MLGIGIDTGGTCTDAVIYDLDNKKILGSGKALTTKSNLEIGISNVLDTLPQDLMQQAELLTLSTTLATNACVENKGARAKLLMLGFEEGMMRRLKDVYASYGFTDMSQFIVMDARAENLFSDWKDPDWNYIRENAEELFSDCDSIGIVQKHPRANGARFELEARRLLRELVDCPITIASEISNEIDILKTCAATLLNARLIPLISEFMEAVHHVMKDRGLNIPLSIVRSDGTLMSEEMAKTYPVETLLCGPAASVIGGSALAKEQNAVILDMGGTTTDIAIIRHNSPVMATKGIQIGQWNTMIQGLYVDTFGLGGDSAVRFKNGHLFLDTTRVIPISVLASQHDFVLPKLRALSAERHFHGSWIHEFYILQKDISGKTGYTKDEQKACELLKNGPLISMDLADGFGLDPHYIHLDRLERDGIIIKSGLTPTDIMILKGDFCQYDKEAVLAAINCMAINIEEPKEEIPDLVYDLVIKRMYKNLGRILLSQQYPKEKNLFSGSNPDAILEYCYQQAKERHRHPKTEGDMEESRSPESAADGKKIPGLTRAGNTDTGLMNAGLMLSTEYPLIGVGAPIHVFLPRVAELLETRAIVPSYSGVANALGAVTARIIAKSELVIKGEYENAALIGYSMFENGQRYFFKDYEKAEKFGREALYRAVQKRAALQGLTDPKITIHARINDVGGVYLETKLKAEAE